MLFTYWDFIMAKIVSSPWSIIRGSIAGTTYLSGRNHAIIARQRTAPTQPNTNARTIVRTAMSTAVVAWELLDDTVRTAWAAYAQTVTYIGPLGPYKPTGRELAIGQWILSRFLQEFGDESASISTSMVAPELAGQLSTPDHHVGRPDVGTGFSINLFNLNDEAVVSYIEGSLGQSSARNYYKGPFVPQTTQSHQFAGGADHTFQVATPTAGRVYFVRVRSIEAAEGRRMSPAYIVRAVSTIPEPAAVAKGTRKKT